MSIDLEIKGAPEIRLLSTAALDGQIAIVEAYSRAVQADGNRHPMLARVLDTLRLLRQPRFNSVAAAFVTLKPNDQVLLADIAVALATTTAGRWKLAILLRHAIGDRS